MKTPSLGFGPVKELRAKIKLEMRRASMFLVIFGNARRDGDMMIVCRWTFCLHHLLLHWFRDHAEWERKLLPPINISEYMTRQQKVAGARLDRHVGLLQQTEGKRLESGHFR